MCQRFALLACSLLVTDLPGLHAQQTQPAKSEPIEYDLLVGDEVYPAIPNQPFAIVTPEGRELEVVLKRREFLRFIGHGVQFDYPRQMRVSVEPDLGFVTIGAETTESVLVMIQVYSAAASLLVSPDYLAQELVNGYRTSLKTVGVRLLDEKPERVILGRKRVGRKVTFQWSDLTTTAEIYTFKQAGKVFGVVLQNDQEDLDQARQCFERIVSSLELSRSKATRPASQPTPASRTSRTHR